MVLSYRGVVPSPSCKWAKPSPALPASPLHITHTPTLYWFIALPCLKFVDVFLYLSRITEFSDCLNRACTTKSFLCFRWLQFMKINNWNVMFQCWDNFIWASPCCCHDNMSLFMLFIGECSVLWNTHYTYKIVYIVVSVNSQALIGSLILQMENSFTNVIIWNCVTNNTSNLIMSIYHRTWMPLRRIDTFDLCCKLEDFIHFGYHPLFWGTICLLLRMS